MTIKNFDKLKRGDTWDGAEFTTTINGVPEDLTNVSLLCEFRFNSKTGEVAVRLTDGDGLTITDAVNSVYKIDAIEDLDWAVGLYYYDIQYIYPDKNKTYVKGTATVAQDVSQA